MKKDPGLQICHLKCNIYIFTSLLLVIAISIGKYRGGDINYQNSDATYHVLLTMQAYEETQISVHKFLPIVSLGGEQNKGISWGACIPDEFGNYYYTSFSPAGYVLPYLFIKLLHLPIAESSLYIFNTLLFAISSIFMLLLLNSIYKNASAFSGTILCTIAIFVSTPQLLHSMGIVYWHQSVMQVTLIAQTFMYYHMRKSKAALFGFYFLCFVNPYIEWTGYVANAGFAFAELSANFKNSREYISARKKGLFSFEIIVVLTALSALLFLGHFLAVVNAKDFARAIISRFAARNITVKVSVLSLLLGYVKSFSYIWLLLIILVAIASLLYGGLSWIRSGKIWENKILLFVLSFPIIENLLMKQHAIEYSFDRMKVVFPLVFLICDLIYMILLKKNTRRMTFFVIVLTICTCCSNYFSYLSSEYIWEAQYREDNAVLAEYINTDYNDSVIGTEDVSVRGYINMLFGRGVYEWTTLEKLRELASETGNRYAILLKTEKIEPWNMTDFGGAEIFDLYLKRDFKINIESGVISIIE